MRKLMLVTIGLVASLVLSIYVLQLKHCIWIAPVSITLLISLFLFRKKIFIWKHTSLFLLGCILGSVLISVFDTVYLEPARRLDTQTTFLTAEVTDYSYRNDKNIVIPASVQINSRNYDVLIYCRDDIRLAPGDSIRGEFDIRFTSFGGDKATTQHQGRGIFLLLFENSGLEYEKIDSVPYKYFAAEMRMKLTAAINTMFPEDTYSFARALLLGDNSELPFQVDNAFKVSGIRHVIAVSGLHVSILFSLIYVLAGKNRFLSALIGIPALVFFAAIAGFTPSVVRACIMHCLMIFALLINKEYDPPTALSFSVFVMLMINPLAITSVSLQLSAGCMIGIFAFSGKMYQYFVSLVNVKGKSIFAKLIRWIFASVSVTVGTMVTTLPLCAYYFGMFSIIGILTNILTLWIISWIFYGIMLSICLYAISAVAGQFVASIISWPIRYVLWISELLSEIPYAAIYTCSIYTVFWLIFAYCILLLFLMSKKKKPFVFVSCILISLFTTILATHIEPRLDNYRISILDVGQGQCILLQADNKQYLVDCGGKNNIDAANKVIHQLSSQGIDSLDGLILTHFDNDHIGGAEFILNVLQVNTIYTTVSDPDTEIDDSLYKQYSDRIVTVTEKVILRNESSTISVFPGEKGKTGNESSLCVLFQTNNCGILITGDRGIASENALVSQYDLPNIDILVAGHHGAKDAVGVALLSAVKPNNVVFSVGADNPFGHPNSDTIKRCKLFGCAIFRTDKQGTIIFRG